MTEILLYLGAMPASLMAAVIAGVLATAMAITYLIVRMREYVSYQEGITDFLRHMGNYTRSEAALNAAAEMAHRLHHAKLAMIYIQDEPESPLVLKAIWPENLQDQASPYIVSPEWVAPDVHHAHTFAPCKLNLIGFAAAGTADHAVLITPVAAGSRLRGYLILAWEGKIVPFTASQACITYGEHLGVVLEHLWMYDAIRAQARTSDTSLTELRREHEARINFMHGVLHDLRNPLQIVRAYLTLVLRTLGDGVPDETTLKSITAELGHVHRSAQRAVDIAETLLQADVPERLKPEIEAIDIADVARQVADEYAYIVQAARLSLIVEAEKSVIAMTDRQATARVLDNLLNNARRHTAAGGRLAIRSYYAGGKAVVEVADSGEGMSEAALNDMLSAPLNQAPSNGRLGIWTARRLVAQMDGEVRGKSTLGSGTTISVYLPAADTAAALRLAVGG